MTEVWAQAALWLALLASLLSIWFRVATALSEIVVGAIAQLIIGAVLGSTLLAGDATWIKFLSGAGAILLTFLAGHVLAVARAPEFGAEVETEAIIENSRRHYADVLQPLQLMTAGLTARFYVMVGHPAESIVLYAEDHGIDHIVVGHRGHSLFERWLIGSVARQVIAYAPCSVTVVRG